MTRLGDWVSRLFHPQPEDLRTLQLEAVDTLARLPLAPRPKEFTTEYDQEATASRTTTPDTHTNSPTGHPTTLKENTMPALHNRALALKLAVENYAYAGGDSEEYCLVDADGVMDDTLVNGVLALADRFVEYLGADEPSTSVPSGDSTPAAPRRRPVDDTESTIEAIRGLLQRSRGQFGDRATTAALEQLDALRSATRGQGKAAVINTAIEFVNRTGRAEFGSVVADRLITGLRSL